MRRTILKLFLCLCIAAALPVCAQNAVHLIVCIKPCPGSVQSRETRELNLLRGGRGTDGKCWMPMCAHCI